MRSQGVHLELLVKVWHVEHRPDKLGISSQARARKEKGPLRSVSKLWLEQGMPSAVLARAARVRREPLVQVQREKAAADPVVGTVTVLFLENLGKRDNLRKMYWNFNINFNEFDQFRWLPDSVQFSHSVVSDSLRPHGLQHAILPCPSPTPGAYSNSCPSSWYCHPTISSSVVPFPSCLQSFPVSGPFLMNQFFTSSGQSIGAWTQGNQTSQS